MSTNKSYFSLRMLTVLLCRVPDNLLYSSIVLFLHETVTAAVLRRQDLGFVDNFIEKCICSFNYIRKTTKPIFCLARLLLLAADWRKKMYGDKIKISSTAIKYCNCRYWLHFCTRVHYTKFIKMQQLS